MFRMIWGGFTFQLGKNERRIVRMDNWIAFMDARDVDDDNLTMMECYLHYLGVFTSWKLIHNDDSGEKFQMYDAMMRWIVFSEHFYRRAIQMPDTLWLFYFRVYFQAVFRSIFFAFSLITTFNKIGECPSQCLTTVSIWKCYGDLQIPSNRSWNWLGGVPTVAKLLKHSLTSLKFSSFNSRCNG